MKKLLLSLAFLFLSAGALHAQYWQQTGFLPVLPFSDGGHIDDILVHRNDSIFTFLYNPQSNQQEISLSSDGGKSWKDTKNITPADGKTLISKSGVMIHSVNYIHQGDSAGLYQSTNFGGDWIPTPLWGYVTAMTKAGDSEFFVSFINSTAANKFQLMHSTDDGLSWTNILTTQFRYISGIVIRPDHQLFVAVYPNVLHSSNFGVSWDTVFAMVNTGSDFSLFVTDQSVMYLRSYYGGDFYSSYSGATGSWKKMPTPPFLGSYTDPPLINAPSVRNGILLVPPYISIDTGKTWDTLRLDSVFKVKAIDSVGTCFLGLDDYIFRSTDNGKSWNDRMPLTANSSYPTPSLVAGSGKDLWAFGTRLYRSSDDGGSWAVLADKRIHYFSAIASGISGSFLAGVEDSSYKYSIASTKDHGATWNISSPVASQNAIFFLGERAPGKLIAMDDNGYCNYSEDNGATWKAVRASSSPTSFNAFYIADSLSLYAVAQGGFFASHDGAMSWKSYITPKTSNIITAICSSYGGAILAVFDSTSLVRSTDGGNSWNPWSDGIPPNAKITGMVRDADSGVYVSTDNGVFYQSATNVNTQWFGAIAGLSDLNVLAITLRNGNALFVACDNTGIFRADNITGAVRYSASDSKNTPSIYPNPASSSVTVTYSLSLRQAVKLELIDQLGRVVRLLRNESEDAGTKNILLPVGDLSAAIYYLRFQSDEGVTTQKIAVEK